jgi:hypothetical protein
MNPSDLSIALQKIPAEMLGFFCLGLLNPPRADYAKTCIIIDIILPIAVAKSVLHYSFDTRFKQML